MMIIQLNTIIHGDCLSVMKDISDNSIDMILCDLPYGTTYCSWDNIIPFEPLWKEYIRITKDNAAIVLTSSQPFTSVLIASNIKMFKYEWIWDKVNSTNFPNAKKQPLKQHENICVFYNKQCTYNPQMTQGKPNHKQGKSTKNISETRLLTERAPDKLDGMKYPKSILLFSKHSSQLGLHPTQKPVDLFRYLIRTYSNPGELILDNCIGSGTTAIAALLENRDFIGIDDDIEYVEIANQRIVETCKNLLEENNDIS